MTAVISFLTDVIIECKNCGLICYESENGLFWTNKHDFSQYKEYRDSLKVSYEYCSFGCKKSVGGKSR